MKEIKLEQVWESKSGNRGTSRMTLEITGKLNANCWLTKDVDLSTTGFISSEDLRREFVLKGKK